MGEVNVCGQIIRFIFFTLNIVSSVIAVGLIAVGSYVIHNESIFTQGFIISGAAITIVAGIVGLLIMCAGLLGAIFLSRVLLGFHLFALGFIITLEITGCVVAAVFRGKISAKIDEIAVKDIHAYRVPGGKEYNRHINEAVDELQTGSKCCGWNSHGNWNPNSSYFKSTNRFPDSCNCTLNNAKNSTTCVELTINGTMKQAVWKNTCKNEIIGFFKRNLAAVAGIAAVFAAFQIVPLVLGCLLCCLIKEDGTVHKRLTTD